MSKYNFRSKISLELILAIVISVGIAFGIGMAYAIFVFSHFYEETNFFFLLFMFAWPVGICVFIFIFLLLINPKIKYLKYVSKKVQDIANQGIGSTIEIKGHDEIAELGKNINLMSLELKRKFDYEREVERSKNELIGSVSHDLRTPLTSIKGYVKLVKDKQFQTLEEMESYIDVAFSKIEILQLLIDELFEYTKLTSQKISLDYERLCLNDIVQQVALDYSPLFREASLALKITIPEEKFYVRIDSVKFVRVIENLLVNALKYSLEPGDVEVSLSAQNQGLQMTISNPAEHIDADSLAHLFEHFYRLEKSRTKETGGTGLGLAIAKSIVEMHAGKIWAVSKHGTVSVHVWLPQNQIE